MPGKGKYSNYSDTIPSPDKGGTNPSKLAFLSKVFPGGPSMKQSDVVSRANANLIPSVQQADVQMFGGPVSLDYAGSPNLAEVAWAKPGDPSTPYTPDVRSPGTAVPVDQLGSTDSTSIQTNLVPRDGNPDVSTAAFAPNYVPGSPTGGTKSPSVYAKKIADTLTIGSDLPKSAVTDSSGGEIYTK